MYIHTYIVFIFFIHTYVRIYIRTYIYTYIHTYIHYTHNYFYSRSPIWKDTFELNTKLSYNKSSCQLGLKQCA